MGILDWAVVGIYLALSLLLGLYLSRRGARSLVDFFVSGRSLPWWLAGTSMAATTFSIDTPLYVCGLVAQRGVAGNWEWWSFGLTHVVMIYIFARLWRRSEIITDAELTELRYGGKPAALLRATKAFLFAVPINCIGMGYALLAMVKVIDALDIWGSLGIDPGANAKLWSVVGVSVLVLIYAGVAGLWGVVVTDLFQFILALGGALLVAVVALHHVGGMGRVVAHFQGTEMLRLWPWGQQVGLSASTLFAYVFVQWWAFRRSDGGGEFIQRLAAAKDEREAERSAWWFNILNYVVRTWPWVVVALVARVIYPDLPDPELGYPKLMRDFLPPVLLGVVVASLLAAFMSTMSTLINWGASYLTRDLYQRFWRPQASQAELVMAGRLASVGVTALGAVAAFYAQDVTAVFRLVIAIGTGPGLVLILRWFWWRINAVAEWTAMVAGFLIGLGTTVVPVIQIPDFGWRLLVTTGVTALVWLTAMYCTAPESEATLNEFYRRIRPGGPGWRQQQQATGLAPLQDLGWELQRTLAGIGLLFGSMLGVGGFLLWQPLAGWVCWTVAVGAGWWLRHLQRRDKLGKIDG
ncbi:sodium:solute symporter family protein [Synechococcus sp. C9]|jgi:SSS family solute:Na+ symporter|uniref:sodium:solute symporter family protein n=1 Tax=Synechococcus sp. C9 TaxID=102119 RepID=UPI001FF2F4E2|nr:sodium:solute symporter family protein [Synechococcus sp. C9]